MKEQHTLKTSKDKILIAQHVLELRHEPVGAFLDVRGFVADYIKNNKYFPHWKIDPNIINFTDQPNKLEQDGAFVGYKSMGYIVYNPGTRNYFVDKASSFWKGLNNNTYYKITKILRFGCRTQAFIPSPKNYDQLNDLMFKTYYTENVKTMVGGKQTGLQLAFDFLEGQFEIKIVGGPLHEKEARNLFGFDSNYFDKCGLFVDIDLYRTKDVDNSLVQKLVREAIKLTFEKIENTANSLEL
jgi:hypothetical protein